MNRYKGKKFVASFSGGKDSTLAVYRAIKQGMIPLELFITYNIDQERSWFHGITRDIINQLSKEINIPISLVETKGESYKENLEIKLKEAKENGAEVCIFGDIDIEDHFHWCTDRCKAAGIEAYFPLWQEDRKSIVYEFIDSGFRTILNVVDRTRMDESYVGNELTRELAEKIEESGVDICGEEGEYHTFVFDGPLFTRSIDIKVGEKLILGDFAVVPLYI